MRRHFIDVQPLTIRETLRPVAREAAMLLEAERGCRWKTECTCMEFAFEERAGFPLARE
jgi:hypothetical protein